MSSTTIDKQIVQMEFDAKKFRGGVQAAMRDISDLKKSFNMTEAMHSILDLTKATEKAGDFSAMENGLLKVSTQFNALGVVGWTVINNLTTAAMDFAKNIASALFIDPVKTGLAEYETQLNAVQTILANTQKEGTTLKDVNSALDELNTYADLTIYNFTQMTNNIGKFTAAGVKLDTSVAAIKGISNLAALSGSDANQASTAMYQLSQAISTGSLKLQDWNSVVNAGMGGQVFQDALMETARVHGVAVDSMIAQDGSFRESLSRGWISSEILLETLNKLTGDLTDEQLRQMGYSEDQIVSIQKQAQTALDAATKIKTVTQLIDTMKEAMQSGWGQTWRIIFGDFEQAKELWGSVAEVIGGLIEEDAKNRNQLLQAWANIGGREKLIQGFFNLLGAGVNVLTAFREAIGDIFPPTTTLQLYRLTKSFLAFSEKLKEGSENLDHFKSIVRGIAAILDIALRFIMAFVKPLFLMAQGVQLVDGGLWALLASVGDAIVAWREWAIETDYFSKVFLKVLVFLRTMRFHIVRLVKQFLELDVVQEVIAWFQQLGREDLLNVWNALLVVLKAIAAPFYLIGVGAKQLYDQLVKMAVIQKIIDWFKGLDFSLDNIREKINNVSTDIKVFIESIQSSQGFQDFVALINTFDGRRMEAFFRDAEEGMSWTETAFDTVKEKLSALGEKLAPVAEGVKNFFGGLISGLKELLGQLLENQEGFDYDLLFDFINAGLLGGLLVAIRKIASGEFLSGIIDDSDFGEALIGGLERLEGTIGSFQNNIRADTLKKVAQAILILAVSILVLTLINPVKLRDATSAIAIMVATLFGSAGALKFVKPQDAIKASIAIIGLAVALNIAAVALKIVSTMDPGEVEQGLTTMGLALAGLVLAINQLRIGAGAIKTTTTIMGIALALLVLKGAITAYGEMDPFVLAQGMMAVGYALTILTAALAILARGTGDKNSTIKASLAMLGITKALDKLFDSVLKFGLLDPEITYQGLKVIALILGGVSVYSRIVKTDKILESAVALLIISGALYVLYEVIKAFGTLSMYEIFVGLISISAILLILAIAARMMQNALPGAIAMVVMAGAILILAGALKILGTLEWSELGIGLAAIAGFLGLFVIAGYLLMPVVPVLMAFGLALFLIGAGAALFGLGIFLAALAVGALGAGLIALGEGFQVFGSTLIENLPKIGVAFADTFANFFVQLAERAPELREAFGILIINMVGGITDVFPQIAEMIGTMVVDLVGVLLEKFVELYSDITQAGWDLLLEFLGGIEDNIKEVVTTALSIITEFIDGISEGLPQVIESAVNLFFTFLEAIESEVITEENIARMLKIGGDIAGNIIKGIVNGIKAGVGSVFSAIADLITGSKTEFEEGYEEHSPSKYTYRVAENLIKGFTNAMEDGTSVGIASITKFNDSIKGEMDLLAAMISDGIDENIELSPVISPVLNLDDISGASRRISRLIGDGRYLTDLSNVNSAGYSQDYSISDSKTQSNGTVQYNQYNYSPKALNRTAIYRQTKTLVARLRQSELKR